MNQELTQKLDILHKKYSITINKKVSPNTENIYWFVADVFCKYYYNIRTTAVATEVSCVFNPKQGFVLVVASTF